MNEIMKDSASIASDWNTNQEVLRYKLIIQKKIRKTRSNKFVLQKLIAFADKYPEEFRDFLEQLTDEEKEEASGSEE